MSHSPDTKVLLVGQLPPPMHGVAAVNTAIMAADFGGLTVEISQMTVSKSLDEIGRLSLKKIGRLLTDMSCAWRALRNSKPDCVVYSVGIRGRSAVLRDTLMIQVALRQAPCLVLQLHTGHMDSTIRGLSQVEQKVAYATYSRATALMRLSEGIGQLDSISNPKDAVVPNGVRDLDQAPLLGGRIPATVTYVGNLYRSKGVEALLEATRILVDQGLTPTVRFAGADTPDGSVAQWQARAVELGVGDSVHFLGVRSPSEVAELLRTTNIFCFPTYYKSEAMPLVVIEAMRGATAIVATRWAAIPSMLEHGTSALLVAPDDSDELADSLRDLLDDPSLGERLGAEARAAYLKQFSQQAFEGSFRSALLAAVESVDETAV